MTAPAPTPPPPAPPLPPEQNIGPYYKAAGVFGILATIGIAVMVLHVVGIIAQGGHDIGIPVVGLVCATVGIPALLAIALIRPALFDALVRQIATHLPTKYGRGGDQ